MTEAQRNAKLKYKSKRKRMSIEFYPPEADLYEHIASQPQKQTYIKDLVRADMAKAKALNDSCATSKTE